MPTEVLIIVGVGEIRVALVADGRLEEFTLERMIGAGCHSLVGDIVLGRVQRVMPGMQAAFVEIGQERAGFLALREAQSLARNPGGDSGISDCVREGEAVLVQIIKDPIGEKGARLSASVTLAGRLLVLVPKLFVADGQPGLSLSRRIEDEATRAALLALGAQLQAAVPDAGFIFRTAAVGASLDELIDDARALAEIWRGIERQRPGARPPATLHRDLGPIERTLRDRMRGAVEQVRIDDAGAAQAARDYCRRAMPGAESRIEYCAAPLFDDALEEEIARLSQPRVRLPSGGWITIETTEALTAIDVNSGRFTQSSGLEETSLTTDLEAAREIGRQLRLRAIGGLIVIDFIHLHRADHAAQVLAALEASLAFDRAPVQISPMSEFGIVAVTRKRTREPLMRLVTAACPACDGTGRQPTPESVALEILRQVEREARANPGRELMVRAAPAVAAWLAAHDCDLRNGLARCGAGRVQFAADDTKAREAFDVRAV